jgi:hypothetical protein
MSTMILGLLAQMQDDGVLTLREIVAEIPHDPAAFLVYALMAVSLYLVWRGSRRKKGGPEPQG